MHDINPLGTTMHLRELDRQAAPKVRQLPSRSPGAARARTIGAALTEFLGHLGRYPAIRVGLRTQV